MKGNIRLVLRLILHVTISFILLGLILGAGLFILTELVFPQDGEGQDTAVLIGLFLILASFGSIYVWFIGKPLFYVISWISRLAGGIYEEPDGLQKIYSGKDKKLKRPYRLYKELILQLHILTDILERSRQEKKRLDEVRKEWIAGISHDLKTPLTYIKGYSSMLLSPQYDWNSEEKTVFLTEIQQKANHMEELIGDLNLSFQLDEQQLPVQWEKHDLVEFIRRIVVDVANDPRSAGSSLTFENDEPQMETLFDMKLLQRALHNLLLNAVLHNPSGTNIKVSITKSTQLQIVISDDGLGMDDKAIDRLYSKYYRGVPTDFRSEGTGLGMAIAKQLVLAHGGDILVTSEINKGTSVVVILPLHN